MPVEKNTGRSMRKLLQLAVVLALFITINAEQATLEEELKLLGDEDPLKLFNTEVRRTLQEKMLALALCCEETTF